MNKAALRKEYLERRLALTKEEVDQISLEIANQALQLDIWKFQTYHIFLPIIEKNEVNTEYLLHILQGKDKNVVISKSNFKDCSMKHYLLTDQTIIRKNKYGIPEPIGQNIPIDEQQIDVVFVPLLIADYHGARVGYGKGFYDRFLKKCKKKTIKIGLSLFKPLTQNITKHTHDIDLNCVLYDEGALIIDKKL